eukprot:TRINITY_DN17540_c0_g1_i2.p1 TRINITY_DN17540_c0_g1~~TRINITY_DN17540_c0_g1_i2.p1  ORF type:complete len:653 (+),score=121.58 TRINITY_DN17540_c0_g1_i2:58-2016(+)
MTSSSSTEAPDTDKTYSKKDKFLATVSEDDANWMVGHHLREADPIGFSESFQAAAAIKFAGYKKKRHFFGLCGRKESVGCMVGIVGFCVCYLYDFAPQRPQAHKMLGITVFMAALWVFEVLPLAATSLLPMVLYPVFGILAAKQTAAAYWGKVQMLFLGAMLVDVAIQQVGLPERLALSMLRKVTASRPRTMVWTIMFLAWFLSMFCTNTATTLMLVPFALGLLNTIKREAVPEAAEGIRMESPLAESEGQTSSSDSEQSGDGRSANRAADSESLQSLSRATLMGIAFSASCGGIATIIGTGSNGVLAGQPIWNDTLSFGSWFGFGLPVSATVFALAGLVMNLGPMRKIKLEVRNGAIETKYQALMPFWSSRDEVLIAGVQLLQIVLWILRPYVLSPLFTDEAGDVLLDDASVALSAAMMLFVLPSQCRPGETLLTWKQAEQHIPWGIMLVLGGGFAIAAGFQNSGLTYEIGSALGSIVTHWHPLVLIYIITFVITFTTEVTSNTATANVILPILSSVSSQTLIHPALLLPAAAVACSFAFMMPAATPPNAVVFATGRVSVRDFVKVGIVMNLLAILVASFVIYCMAGLALGAFEPFPQYACLPEQCVWLPVRGMVDGTEVRSQACALLEDLPGLCRLRNKTEVEYKSLLST